MLRIKKQIFLCFCVLAVSLSYAMPVSADIEEELSFEDSASFGVIENSGKLQTPSFSQQSRLKFYDSDDGDWNAGLGVALIEPQSGDATSNDTMPIPLPFFNIKYKFRNK